MNNKLGSDDKENRGTKDELVIEKLILNGLAKMKGLNEQNNATAVNDTATDDNKDAVVNPTNIELLMCTANPKACPVHTENYAGPRWGFYHTEEEINALIGSLNPRGVRERILRENLENEKELILAHIKDCPLEKITANATEKDAVLSAIITKYAKKYDTPNFNHEPGTDANVILETALRENMLELESRITVGYLGSMKVTNREEWREALEQFDYKQLSEPLRWGCNRVMAFKEKKEDQEEEDEGMENDESDDDTEKLLSHEKDPGYDLPDTNIIESEDSSDEVVLLHDSASLQEKVHSLAKALLQIEQCIDSKFLLHPFGPRKEHKDKATLTKKLIQGQKNLARWEESLMRATNFSQIFMHYNVLYDAIQWSRSAERATCMICRRKGDPNMALLCDECNRACHMYCLKPKLKQVPEGDWFCPKCRPEDYTKKRQTKKRKVFVEEEPAEEEEEELAEELLDDDAEEDEEDDEESTEEEEIMCKKCKTGGASAVCHTCSTAYHPECTKSLSSTPKKRWNCDKCTKKSSKDSSSSSKKKDKSSKKSKSKKKVSVRLAAAPVDDDSFEDYDEENDEEEAVEDEEQMEVEESKPSSRRRSSNKRKMSDEEEASDEETLASKQKRNRRSTTAKRSLTNGYHDEDVDVPSPAASKSRRSAVAASDELDSSSSSRRGRRTGDDLPLNSVALYTLIDDILKHADSWPFNRPVSVKEVPDYYTIIKNPMDFAKIKSKLNMGEYTINEQMMNDVQLVFRNCDLYNTDETDIYRTGRSLERYVLQRAKELSLPFKSSDMLKNDNQLLVNGSGGCDGNDDDDGATPKMVNGDTPKAQQKLETSSSSGSGKRRSNKK